MNGASIACPFCLDNDLFKGVVIAKTADAYLARTESSPNNYLIIPSTHVESPQELPDTWWHEVNELLNQLPQLPEHYNLSLNIGSNAGQTVRHLHFWVILRMPDSPSAGKGLARLIKEADTSGRLPQA